MSSSRSMVDSRLVAILCAAALLPAAVSALDLPDRSISTSGQFIVYADDPVIRTSTNSDAERVKHTFVSLLRMGEDDWAAPIVITMRPRGGVPQSVPPASVKLLHTVQGPKIEVNILTGPSDIPVRFRRQITEALLLDTALRQAGNAIPEGAKVPGWMVSGVSGFTETGKAERERFAGVVQVAGMPDIDVFVLNPPGTFDESLDATVYDVYATALVSSVLDLPDGRAIFKGMLVDSLTNPSARGLASLTRLLNATQGVEQLQKLWALQLAELSETGGMALPQPERSAKTLQEQFARTVSVESDDGTQQVSLLEAIPLARKDDKVRNQLVTISLELKATSGHSNPLTAPVFAELASLCEEMSDGKAKQAASKMGELAGLADEVAIYATEITDYLNWVEATRIVTGDDPFGSYFRMADRLSESTDGRRRQGGAVAEYLDGMESLLGGN